MLLLCLLIHHLSVLASSVLFSIVEVVCLLIILLAVLAILIFIKITWILVPIILTRLSYVFAHSLFGELFLDFREGRVLSAATLNQAIGIFLHNC